MQWNGLNPVPREFNLGTGTVRTFNLRLLFWLVGIFLVVAVVVHFVHGFQVRRNAGVYKTLAEKERSLAEEESQNAKKFTDTAGDLKKTQADRDAAAADGRKAAASAGKAAANAIQHYRRYLSFVPGDVGVRADYGKLLVSVGAFAQANSQLERVLREGGGDDETRKMLVDVATQLGLYPSAEHHLAILLDKAGNKDGELLEKLGTSQLLRGEYEKAKESLELAIKNSPNQLTSYWLLAEVLRDRLKNPEEARKKVDEMADRNPDNADAHIRRAHFLLRDRQPLTEQGSLAEAEKACTRALALQPENSDALALASNCRQRNDDILAAREFLRKALAISPNVPQRYLQLAELELDGLELLASPDDRKARFDAAIEAVRQGVRAIPEPLESIDLRWKLADFLILKERTQEETTELETLLAGLKQLTGDVKKRPNVDATKVAQVEAKIAFLDASKLCREEKWFEARQVLEANRNELAKSMDLLVRVDSLLARCYSQLGDDDLSLTAASRVLDSNPGNKEARRQYADSLLAVGRLSEASREYEQLVGMYGKNVPVDVLKRSFSLRFVEAVRKSDKQSRAWDQLATTLNVLEPSVPNDPWVPLMKAELLFQKGNFDAADATLSTACESTEMQNVQALRMALVDLAIKQGDLTKAAHRLNTLEAKFGDTVGVRMAKARLLKQKGKDGLAELGELANDLGKFTPPEQLQLYWQLALLCRSEPNLSQGLAFGRQAAATGT